jgi:hypothetical protein
MTRLRVQLVLLNVLLTWGASSLVAQRPLIAVGFHVERRTKYQTHFQPGTLKRVSDSIGVVLRSLLAEHVGFLEYGTDSRSPYSLLVTLDRSDTLSDNDDDEVGFRAILHGPQVSAQVYLRTFREAGTGDVGLGNEAEFRRSVTIALLGLQDKDYAVLVRWLFSRVPIADSGLVWRSPFGVILPLRRVDFCFGEDSHLQALSHVRQGVKGTQQRVPAHPGEFNPPVGAVPEVLAMKDRVTGWADSSFEFDSLQVLHVYVDQYQFGDDLCDKTTPPSEVTFVR